jgi:hypothetical protein
MKSSGKLVIDPINKTKKQLIQSNWKKTAIIQVNDDVHLYYKWLIERRYPLIFGQKSETGWINPPLRGTHITIINDRYGDDYKWNEFRNLFNNTELNFEYDPLDGIRNNGEHIYIKVNCPDGQNLRNVLGLGEPYYGFHLTIGRIDPNSQYKFEHNKWVSKYMILNK